MEIGDIVKVIGPRNGGGRSSEGIYWNPAMGKYISGIYRIMSVSRRRYSLEPCVFGDKNPDIVRWVFSAEWLSEENMDSVNDDITKNIDAFLSEYN